MKNIFIALFVIGLVLVLAQPVIAQDDDECGPTICDGERRHVGCSSILLLPCAFAGGLYFERKKK